MRMWAQTGGDLLKISLVPQNFEQQIITYFILQTCFMEKKNKMLEKALNLTFVHSCLLKRSTDCSLPGPATPVGNGCSLGSQPALLLLITTRSCMYWTGCRIHFS